MTRASLNVGHQPGVCARNPHFAGARRALLRTEVDLEDIKSDSGQAYVPVGRGVLTQTQARRVKETHVRSEGSVFLPGVRISGDNCAKIHAEPAVMMPTQRNVA
ncbi:hypothetical protein LMG9964_02906 [Paraburkholderia phenoliruptrix]|uniref:Uncharacterized protein n=1 Tax=Paraburkholderia phenoliruptrix TaxID=252970 RepID=A0A6J5K6A5_9BURK|nr:hypothetical protein LMG9964_02906 [Paraburkholderia phenoliruptrix]